jgi:hypothetical protein
MDEDATDSCAQRADTMKSRLSRSALVRVAVVAGGALLVLAAPPSGTVLAQGTPRVAPPQTVHCQLINNECVCGSPGYTGKNIPCRPEFMRPTRGRGGIRLLLFQRLNGSWETVNQPIPLSTTRMRLQ